MFLRLTKNEWNLINIISLSLVLAGIVDVIMIVTRKVGLSNVLYFIIAMIFSETIHFAVKLINPVFSDKVEFKRIMYVMICYINMAFISFIVSLPLKFIFDLNNAPILYNYCIIGIVVVSCEFIVYKLNYYKISTNKNINFYGYEDLNDNENNPKDS